MTPKARNTTNAIIIFGILAFVIACSCPNLRDRDSRNRGSDRQDREERSDRKDDKELAENEDEGDFVVEHTSVRNPKFNKIDEQFRENKVLEKAADKLNRVLILPEDIVLRTKDCDQTNAFYNPQDRSITFCYELMEYFFKLYKLDGDSDRKAK